MSETPNLGMTYLPENVLDPSAGFNAALNQLDTLVQCAVISMGQTSPPESPVDGDMYIVPELAGGLWAGKDRQLARYVAQGDFWQYYNPGEAVWLVLNRDDGSLYSFNEGSPYGWNVVSSEGGAGVGEVTSYLGLAGIGSGIAPAPDADTNRSRIFGVPIADFVLPAVRYMNGMWQLLGNPFFCGHARWMVIYSGTNVDASHGMGTSGSGTGTNNSRTPSAATTLGQVATRQFTSSAATNSTGAVGQSAYNAVTGVYRAVSGHARGGGFYASIRGGWPTIRADQRVFMGLRTSANPTGEPSAFTECFGIGADEADVNLQLMCNDGSGTCTKVDLGVAKTAVAGDLLELFIAAPPGGGAMQAILRNISTEVIYIPAAQISNLPSVDTALGCVVWANTGVTTTTAVASCLQGFVAQEFIA